MVTNESENREVDDECGTEELWPRDELSDKTGAPPEPPRGYRPADSGQESPASESYEPNRRYPPSEDGITTRMKVGWVALGFFLGIFSPIIIFLFYWRRDPEIRMAAIRYTLAGIAASLVAEFLLLGWLTSVNPEMASQLTGGSVAEPGEAGWTSTNF